MTEYLPAMGRHWLLPLYDPFTRLARVGRIHEHLLDRADLRAGHRVLEIGCGTGNLLTALGRRGPAVDAVGIDPDPAALKRARRKATRAGLPIRYEQAFAGALPQPDASLDRVLSVLMLHHLAGDERLRALAEVRRVLRPGRQVHVADVDGQGFGGRHPQVAGASPDLVLAAMETAGLTGVRENGRTRVGFAGIVFYRAEAAGR